MGSSVVRGVRWQLYGGVIMRQSKVIATGPPPLYRPYIFEATEDAAWDAIEGYWAVTVRRVNLDGTTASVSTERAAVGIGDITDDPPIYEGDRCVLCITADTKRVVVPFSRTETGNVHPWKLRKRDDGDIEVFGGVFRHHGIELAGVTTGQWSNTSIAAPGEVWILVSSDLDSIGTPTIAANISDDGTGSGLPAGITLLQSYKLGSVATDGTVTQVRRSDIHDDDKLLSGGSGIIITHQGGSASANGGYNGAWTATIDIDDSYLDNWWSSSGYPGSIVHNSTTYKQGGDPELDEFYHLTLAEYNALQAML